MLLTQLVGRVGECVQGSRRPAHRQQRQHDHGRDQHHETQQQSIRPAGGLLGLTRVEGDEGPVVQAHLRNKGKRRLRSECSIGPIGGPAPPLAPPIGPRI